MTCTNIKQYSPPKSNINIQLQQIKTKKEKNKKKNLM